MINLIYLLLFNVVFQVNYTFSSFPVEKKLFGKRLQTKELLSPCDISYLSDNKFIIQNCEGDYFFEYLDLDTKDHFLFCRKGRGPGEVIFPGSYQYVRSNGRFLVYDIIQQKIVVYDFKKIIKKEESYYIDESNMRIQDAYVKIPFYIDDGSYFCVLLGDGDGYRICGLNIKKDRKIEKYVTFPKLRINYPTMAADGVIETCAEISPDRKNIVVAYEYWDKIDIFNSNGDLKKTIYGPKYKMPEVVVKNNNVFPKKVVECYFDIATGPNSFMILYYGLSEPKDVNTTIESIKYVLEFDYSGKPLGKYILDPGVFSISVDWGRKIIFGLNMDDMHIYQFNTSIKY